MITRKREVQIGQDYMKVIHEKAEQLYVNVAMQKMSMMLADLLTERNMFIDIIARCRHSLVAFNHILVHGDDGIARDDEWTTDETALIDFIDARCNVLGIVCEPLDPPLELLTVAETIQLVNELSEGMRGKPEPFVPTVQNFNADDIQSVELQRNEWCWVTGSLSHVAENHDDEECALSINAVLNKVARQLVDDDKNAPEVPFSPIETPADDFPAMYPGGEVV